ncbi:MAG: cytochrome c biogenesis CcdA family protein [Vulcanimicrobiaceae bacterium]
MDIVQAAIAGVDARAVTGPLLCFATGLLTSLGPCVAPRLIAVASIGGGQARLADRYFCLASLVCGLCVGYLALGLAGSALSLIIHMSSWLYAVVSALLLLAGARSIFVARKTAVCKCADDHLSLGSGFMLGASFALVISPCCTPIIVAIVGFGQAYGDWTFAGISTLSFAVGHAVPLIVAGFASVALRERLLQYSQAASVVSGTLLVGLAGYYAVLV